MADKYISSSNQAFNPISSSSELLDVTAENTGRGAPPPPTIRSKDSEQRILNRQQASKSVLAQTQPDFIASPSLQTTTPVESAKAVSTGTKFPPLTMHVTFIANKRVERGMFFNVSDTNQLFSDIKQRYGVEGEFSLISAGKLIKDTSQLHAAWHGCEGMFHVVQRQTFDPISSSSRLINDTTENTGRAAPPPPTIRFKDSEQKSLNRQQANKSALAQTQPDFIANASLQTSTPVESAKAVSTGTKLPPVTVYVKFFGNGRMAYGMFDNVSDISQLFSDMKQRYGIEGELRLIGAGKQINDMSQLHAAWHGCDGLFHVVEKKT